MTAPVSATRNTKLLALAAMRCQRGAPRLSESELTAQLAVLPGWSASSNVIEKTFSFANYYETIAFVNALAYITHRVDHHPDLAVHYNRCVVRYSTHDAGGVTLNDCICAALIEKLGS
jgi:4a-hydroxytetrahydrobiopterin dehydratase